jgi:hypothetical protein
LRANDVIPQAVPMRPALPVRITVLAALAVLGPLAGGGCGAIEQTQQVISRSDLVNDLASRLDRANELDYTAQYQLASGQTATIAQARKPLRDAYSYPGGKVVISTTATAECAAQGATTTCTLTPPPLSTSGPPPGVLDAAEAQGLVHPTRVMSLLTAAALDSDALVKQSDTTIAGQHATCIEVSQAERAAVPPFKTCVTTEGVLGSFSGDLDGKSMEVSLLNYSGTASATAFDLPSGAKIADQRRR